MQPGVTLERAREVARKSAHVAFQAISGQLDKAILKAARSGMYTTQVELSERPPDAIVAAYTAYKIRVERAERGHVGDRDDRIVYVVMLDWTGP